ncbi:MAG: hypothetical protein QXV17_11590 [Candidatus Micrarchaeaceae archaeon]
MFKKVKGMIKMCEIGDGVVVDGAGKNIFINYIGILSDKFIYSFCIKDNVGSQKWLPSIKEKK